MTAEGTRAALPHRLRSAAAELPGEGVPLQWLAQAHGPAAQGSLLVLLAVPCLLPVPGSGTVVGMGICALAAALWRGPGQMGLPKRVGDFRLSQRWAGRVLRLLATAYALAGMLSRPRLSHLATGHPHGLLAALVGVMAVIIVLPIPFGNVLPALALMLLGIGLVFHDGLAVLLGWLLSALALLFTGGVFAAAWWLARSPLPAWLPWPQTAG